MSTNDIDFTSAEFPPLNDVLQSHLIGCAQCLQSLEKKPIPNIVSGGTISTGLCQEWFKIIARYADLEGKINNIVAHDEYGNEAFHHETILPAD